MAEDQFTYNHARAWAARNADSQLYPELVGDDNQHEFACYCLKELETWPDAAYSSLLYGWNNEVK